MPLALATPLLPASTALLRSIPIPDVTPVDPEADIEAPSRPSRSSPCPAPPLLLPLLLLLLLLPPPLARAEFISRLGSRSRRVGGICNPPDPLPAPPPLLLLLLLLFGPLLLLLPASEEDWSDEGICRSDC